MRTDHEGPRVEREVVLELGGEEAWETISDSDLLEEWLADRVELEPFEGAQATFVVDGQERHGEVREVEPGRRIAFTWRAPEEPATLVELTLVPVDRELTRLHITETAPGGIRCAVGSPAAWSARAARAPRACALA